jgi:hypothetical protein
MSGIPVSVILARLPTERREAIERRGRQLIAELGMIEACERQQRPVREDLRSIPSETS